MITLLGTSKTMRQQKYPDLKKYFTKPVFEEKTKIISDFIKKLDAEDISKIMKTSEKLSNETYYMFKNFSCGENKNNLTPAVLSFIGDVFKAMDIEKYKTEDFLFAQKNFFILSGMYGLLRPLDLIEPYRLEMGYVLNMEIFKKISEFWKKELTDYLNSVIDSNNSKFIIDLASKEFTDSIDKKKLKLKLTDIVFKDKKDDKLKVIAIYAKRARGTMADFIIKNKIREKEELKKFNGLGYSYNKELSGEYEFTFTR
jgi:hypothetical protein